MTKPTLPAEVHDHFRKANILHAYVQQNLGESIKHAFETGRELMAAKAAIPHGRWGAECERLFDGSPRTARFYMQFAKHCAMLKTAQKNAILYLETTLESAAKTARKAASPPSEETDTMTQAQDSSSALDGNGFIEKPGRTSRKKRPPKQYDRTAWYKQWDRQIGPLVKLVDKIANDIGEKHSAKHKRVLQDLRTATDDIMAWLGVADNADR